MVMNECFAFLMQMTDSDRAMHTRQNAWMSSYGYFFLIALIIEEII